MKNIKFIYTIIALFLCNAILVGANPSIQSIGEYLNIPVGMERANSSHTQPNTPNHSSNLPKSVEVLFNGLQPSLSNNSPSVVCLDDAGLLAATIDGTSINNGNSVINFVNFGSTIAFTHTGGDASQDGNAMTTPGFDIAIYNGAPPTATGPTAADINNDVVYTGSVVGTSLAGNITFQNTGTYQNTFNSGSPTHLWFAPITLDDHANQLLTENAGNPDECVNVNVSQQFNMVFLNQIDTFNFTNPAIANGDRCEARIRLSGGLPQWDASNFTIVIQKSTNPAVTGTISASTSTVTHNSLLEFTVPEPGDYDIVVTDNNGATRTFTVPMNGCVACLDTAGSMTAMLGTTAASSNVNFLCFGDSITFVHDGNAILTGDPNPNTPSGLGYVMYNCQPTSPVASNTVAAIASDACIINQSGSSAGFDLVSNTDINGNVTIVNNGLTYQNILGGIGSTGQLWFAPITIDNYANGGFEDVNSPNECTNVGVGAAQSIVFLNQIEATPIGTNICDGSFSVIGGLPQYNSSAYNITIELTTNTLITGTVTNAPVTHGGTAQFTVPQPGFYRITITDTIGCGSPNNTNTFLVDMNNCPFPCAGVVNTTLNITAPISCNGGNDGQLTASVNGGTPPLTYEWSHNPALTANIATGLAANSYTVTVTDLNGCLDTQTVILSEPDAIIIDLDSTPILCNGDMNSSIWVQSVTGGTAPYLFSWSGGTVNNDTTSNLGAGTYIVTVTDANSCSVVDSLTLTAPAALSTIMTDIVNTDCDASANGTATVVPTGGTTTHSDFNYSWSHNMMLNDSVATGLASGTYYVTVTDDNGCSIIDSVSINAVKTIVITADSLDAQCNGENSGMAWVTATTQGGTANIPYSYAWSHDPMEVNDTAMNLVAGTYFVTVTDALGCFAIDTINISEPDTLIATIQGINNVSCIGDMTGSATINATGGVMPYTYAWSGSASTTASLSNVGAGTYIATVTDANGCTDTIAINIGTNSNLMVTQIDTTPLVCAGNMNGGFMVTYSGGVLPYTYAWSTNPTNDTTNAITGIGTGTYYLTVTDNIGCTRIDTLTLTAPSPITGTMSASNLICSDDQNGEVSISVVGGTMPYTYTWSASGVNNDTITGLTAGIYMVTVTDANGCTYMDSATVTAPDAINIDLAITPVSCLGGSNGTAIATVTGGTGAYTYLWDSLQTGQTASQLIAGQHTLIVTDQAGCQVTETFIVNQVPTMTPSNVGSQPVSCFGGTDGTAYIAVNGGTEPYSYVWNTTPQQTTDTAVGLSQGTYQVFVTDANGCALAPISITVNEPTQLVIDTVITSDPLCHNSADGSVTVIPMGGTPSYNYSWSGSNSVTNTDNDLTAGSYTVTVTDANGCQRTAQATLDDPLILVGQISTSPTTCNGGKDGRIQIDTVLGGFPPYTYSIDELNYLPTDIIYFGLFGGNYDVTILDSNGCAYTETVLIEEPPLITVDLGPDIELDLGDSVQLEAFVNTTDSVTYIWETSDSSTMSCFDCFNPWIFTTSTAEYEVTVIDTNGCEAADDIIIEIDKNRRTFIPSAFTPNGDGINDKFVIFGGTGVVEIVSFKVFNRWGELVHMADNFAPGSERDGWDGTFRGQLMDPGVFVYFIEVRFSDGVIFPYKGDVTLIR